MAETATVRQRGRAHPLEPAGDGGGRQAGTSAAGHRYFTIVRKKLKSSTMPGLKPFTFARVATWVAAGTS